MQVLIYQALGWPTPTFAHVSLILAPDKSKLSKRHGATSVGEFRDQGFLPNAMVNFLSLLGWNDGTEQARHASRPAPLGGLQIERRVAECSHTLLRRCTLRSRLRATSLYIFQVLLEARCTTAGDLHAGGPAAKVFAGPHHKEPGRL